MRSEGNVYNPVPERVPRARNAEEYQQMTSKATELACDIRLHRSFVLQPNPRIQRNVAIRVSYSDVGYSGSSAKDVELHDAGTTEIPVILWAGGMFGGRYQAIANDDICKRCCVRFIAVDRPGIGGTDAVNLNQRVPTWLDIVPALLNHLDVKHVHLAAHSAGTIFVLNTILHQRHLLDPHRPSVALFGPWVHPSKSGHLGMSAVGLLPEVAIGTWHHWAKLVHANVAPALRAGGFTVTKPSKASSDRIWGPAFREDGNMHDGTESEWRKASEAMITNYIYAENVEGASQEALLCLRKGDTTWGDWQDLDEGISRIADQERVRRSHAGEEIGYQLKFRIYFAEKDEMIGEKGQNWLQSCFTEGEVAEMLDLESEVVPQTDHNDILAVQNGAMEKLIRCLGQLQPCQRER